MDATLLGASEAFEPVEQDLLGIRESSSLEENDKWPLQSRPLARNALALKNGIASLRASEMRRTTASRRSCLVPM